VRAWLLRFNAVGPRGLIDRKLAGQARMLTAQRRQAVMAIIESGLTTAIHGVVRWRLALSYLGRPFQSDARCWRHSAYR